jgi:hypothetical protein
MRSSIVTLSLVCLIVSLPAAAAVRHRAGVRRSADGGTCTDAQGRTFPC